MSTQESTVISSFLRFRDCPAGRQACIQGSTLAVWELVLLVGSYNGDLMAVAKHLHWSETKVLAGNRYAEAFPVEIEMALAENEVTDFAALKRILPEAFEFVA